MPNFNLDNYETVEDRLKQYWKDNPSGKIETNVVHITDDGTCVTIKAEVFVNTDEQYKCIATGIAQETKGQGGFANKDAWVENCETSAIGRALANWNYQGSKAPRPSRQEMSKVGNNEEKVEVTKVDMRKKENQMTDEQKNLIKEIADDVVSKPKTDKSVAQQLKVVMTGIESNPQKRVDIQREAYTQSISEHKLPEEVEDWDNEQMSTFLNVFEKIATSSDTDAGLITEVFGEVQDNTRNCPECGKSDWIEDNRKKKQEEPDKYGAIPSWSCSNYKEKDGCGWKAWGDTDCPSEWL
tara:strand:- start:306 stop:1196 length:891 start_codon:yes stop_codon:yes gene_type:complete